MLFPSEIQFPLERETYGFEPADFVYMLLFNATVINIASLWLGILFNGVPLILSCVYIWSRNFGEGNVSLCGLNCRVIFVNTHLI